MYCPTPGLRIRSRGMGRGLARGRGLGPIGIPYRMKFITPISEQVSQSLPELAGRITTIALGLEGFKAIVEDKIKPLIEKYPDAIISIEQKMGAVPFPPVPSGYQKIAETRDVRVLFRPSKVMLTEIISNVIRQLAPGMAIGFLMGLAVAYFVKK